MAVYRIEIRNRDGYVVAATDDRPLLESLEAAGMRLPFGCRYGACATCAALLIAGAVDHSAGRAFALRSEQRERGYILPCVARPRTDCVIQVGTQRGLYRNPFKEAWSGRERRPVFMPRSFNE